MVMGALVHNALAGARSGGVRTSDAMAKTGPSRLRPFGFWITPITRLLAQKSACKNLRCNGQSPAITLKAA